MLSLLGGGLKMAGALGAIASASAVAIAQSTASAIASATATAIAGISISIALVAGQAVREVSGAIRDFAKVAVNNILNLLRRYFDLLVKKPEIGLTGTLLLLYILT